jgi:chromosome segregation ATPase
MAARLITPEAVANACSELVKAGETPSTLKVHKMLGKGSPNTVQKFIRLWRDSEEAKEAKADQLPAVIKLPAEFQSDAELFLKKIFKLAEQHHSAKVEQINQERDQAVAAAQQEAQDSLEYAEGIGQKNEELTESLVAANDQIVALEKEFGSLQNRVDSLEKENQDLNEQLDEETETARSKIEELAASLSVNEKSQALLEQEKNQAVQSLLDAKSEHSDALESLNSKHDAYIVELKSEHSSAIKELKSGSDKATKDLKDAHRQALSLAENSLKDVQSQRKELFDSIKTEQAINAKYAESLKEKDSLINSLQKEVNDSR